MKYQACLRCGFCCSKSVCQFGKWDEEKKHCAFLKFNGDFAKCNKYAEILTYPFSNFEPAFGAGCCMNLNTLRNQIKQVYFKGEEQWVDGD